MQKSNNDILEEVYREVYDFDVKYEMMSDMLRGYNPSKSKFTEITYDIYTASDLIGRQAGEEWFYNVFLNQSVDDQNRTPILYQMVKYFGINKDDLIDSYVKMYGWDAKNIVEALYEPDENIMMLKVANPYALVFNGEIYTWFEILAAARNLLPEIYNEIVNIPKEVFTQYFKQIDPLYSTYIKHADLELVEEFIMSK